MVVAAGIFAAALLSPVAAHATVPGANGKLAFTSTRDGNWEIYSMNPDGSGVARLTNDPSYDFSAAWSPDGTKILFVTDRPSFPYNVWLMNADGTGQTQLTTQGGLAPVWYPDGASFAYLTGGAIH